MKNSLLCPKCKTRKLWRIERFAAEDERRSPAALRVAVHRLNPLDRGLFGAAKSYTVGQVDAFICAQCGYTELWSSGFEDLVANPDDGVHVIDTSPQQSEYR